MKALILDDSPWKLAKITRILQNCGIETVKYVTDQQSGLELIYESVKTGEAFDLIVTDMHYPLKSGAVADTEAGQKLLERLRQEGIAIPVIVCSSLNFALPEAFGTVWYNEIRDIEEEFRRLVGKLQRR
ncbi:MAG: response regulator [Lachnospiraceae bacterium]|nr:response regulator [Lachnospiraceae bacterium]MBP3609307.1 response regulator [Lachnospiraceae bacterium]